MSGQRILPILLAGLLLAGCAAPNPPAEEPFPVGSQAVQGGQGSGGGSVGNLPPVWQSFNGTLTTAENSGGVAETFTGKVLDANGEKDFTSLTIRVTGVVSGNFTRVLEPGDANQLTEPASFGADNWKVWTDVKNDGFLWLKFRYTFPLGAPAGTATFTPNAKDGAGGAGVDGTPDATTVSLFSEITVAAQPVSANGNVSTGSWGGWTATPGATNVEAANYLKLTNTGQKAAAQVVIDFSEAALVGSSDPNYTIPVASNVEFAWFEDTTPAASAPNEGTYAWSGANADGSATVAFSGLNNVLYVTYRIKQLPAVLAIQSYAASYTATEL